MQEKNIDIWKKKLDWLADKGGMALVNTHSDYMIFNDNKPKIEEYPAKYYEEFFKYVKKKYGGQYWHALANEVAGFWLSKGNYKVAESRFGSH
jgi:hypothetical protein